MRLTRLSITRLPGIERPFELDVERQGGEITVVLGPNGSGKSSLFRALCALVWPEEADGAGIEVVADFEDGARRITASRREGHGVVWTSAGGTSTTAPSMPAAHVARSYRLGLTDLVKSSPSEDEQGFAEELVRLARGGFDVRAVRRRAFESSARPGFGESMRHSRAQEARRRVEREQGELVTRRRGLASLRSRFERAIEAAERRARAEKAIEVADALAGERRLEDNLRALPQGMDRLSASTGTRLGQIDAERERLEQELDAARRESDHLGRGLAELELAGVEPSAAELADAIEAARDARDGERELAVIERELAAVAESSNRLVEELGVERPRGATPEVVANQIAEAGTGCARLAESRERLAGLESQLEIVSEEACAAGDADPVRRAVAALSEWLAAPRAAAPRAAAAVSGAALAGVGAFLALTQSAYYALATAVGLAALAVGLLSARRTSSRSRAAARERFEETGREPPPTWAEPEVRARLAEELKALALIERAIAASARRDALEDRRREERERLDAQSRELEQLRQAAGLRAGVDEMRVALVLDALKSLAEAERKRAEHKARSSRVASDLGACRDAARRVLADAGLDAPERPAALETALVELKDRLSQRDADRDRLASVRADLERLDAARSRAEAALDELLSSAGLSTGQRDALEERIERWPEYERLRQQLASQRALVADRRRVLGEEGSTLLELSESALEGLRAESDALSRERDDLRDQISRIEAEIEKAEAGSDLAQAVAEEREAERALLAARERELQRAAGALLVDRVERRLAERQPEVLRRAGELLALFTGGAYSLRVGSETGSAELQAQDEGTGAVIPLAQLSDGTRSQLLLAVRLAFVESSESSARLPLFLDEALTASDPDRFASVVRALVASVLAGRQVFYLTCDPADVEQWRRSLGREHEGLLRTIDLGELRGLGATGPVDLPPPAKRTPPDGLSPAEYAQANRIPAWDPGGPIAQTPLFYPLVEHLDLHFRLSERGVSTIGSLRNLVQKGISLGIDADSLELVFGELSLVEAFLESYARGRGRPVGRDVLASSQAVSDVFLNRVWELCELAAGDAKALIRRLEAGDVPRFRAQNIEQLRRDLEASGHLDPREPLDYEALRSEVLRVTGRTLEKGAERAIRRYWSLSEEASTRQENAR